MVATKVYQLFPEEPENAPAHIAQFAQFWAMYPRRVAKRDAEKMWIRLTRQEQQDAIKALPAHIRYWQQAGRTMETTPHAATWLNGHRFEDELPEGATTPMQQVVLCCECRQPLTGGWMTTNKGKRCDTCTTSNDQPQQKGRHHGS